MRRSGWLVLSLVGVGCVCGGPELPDGGFDSGAADAGLDAGRTTDAGGSDAGLDAGRSDAGSDAGVDGGADGGRDDAGAADGGDDGGSLGCAQLLCPPWQTCVEAGGARCVGTVSITWVSPVSGASAPVDLEYVPLGIDTTAGSAIDVPWTSSGVISATGVFSGQAGVRSSTLFLTDADAGAVVLTAGWPGGPIASTVLQVMRPIVRVPPAPSYGTNSADFEPNDPAGPAFRRDDVVPIEVDDLPQPMALFARLDAPNARPVAVPIIERCDAGTCRRVDLDLKPLHFPAFRGRVLVWATAADGGMQTRPRSVPVTRWRWRRQVSNVANPRSVTRPVLSRSPLPLGGTIVVGSSDAVETGRLLSLFANGAVATPASAAWPNSGVAITSLTGASPAVVATAGPDGGAALWDDLTDTLVGVSSPIVTCATSEGVTVCVSESGHLERTYSFGGLGSAGVGSGCPPGRASGLYASRVDTALVFDGAPMCVARFDFLSPYPVLSTTSTTGQFGRAFAVLGGINLDLLGASADGGVWRVERSSPLTERSVWNGGVVDGIAALEVRDGSSIRTWAYWATDDLRVHRAEATVPFRFETVSSTQLPERISTTPVLAYDTNGDGGTAIFVSRNGAVSAFDADTMTLAWTLEAGDAGVRGGRVDTEPIGTEFCNSHGALLVPSSGDGSLYAFTLDGPTFTWRFANAVHWPMAGRTPENELGTPSPGCVRN